jgi:hypothetical protein
MFKKGVKMFVNIDNTEVNERIKEGKCLNWNPICDMAVEIDRKCPDCRRQNARTIKRP